MQSDLQAIADAFRVLGALFYLSPRDSGMADIRNYLAHGNLQSEWPWGTQDELNQISLDFATTTDLTVLAAHHQRLFFGPGPLLAPPWGSVYLDKQNCLFGDSTQALVGICAKRGIAPTQQYHTLREPLDHFGFLCFMIAISADADDESLARSLLVEHLLPWSNRFLSLFDDACLESPFYRACGRLASLSLCGLQARWATDTPSIELYF